MRQSYFMISAREKWMWTERLEGVGLSPEQAGAIVDTLVELEGDLPDRREVGLVRTDLDALESYVDRRLPSDEDDDDKSTTDSNELRDLRAKIDDLHQGMRELRRELDDLRADLDRLRRAQG
jgi:chromosome segregation ATPase